MLSNKGGMTLAEHTKLCEADPDWIARRDANEQKRVLAGEESHRQQAPLLQDLESVGIIIFCVWDLVNTAKPYPSAWPILLAHLSRPYEDRIRERIARSLAVKDARAIVWDRLVELMYSEPPQSGAKAGMMVAISAMACPSDLKAIIDLISDPSIGSCRLFLVSNLMRSKKPEARQVLLALRDDPDLRLEINPRLRRSAS